ncbi:UNKNOWN [Stylonychia lemnae]|uniref:Uncharacterized protein n=1 Tax=Stylonychia lemnae TaxID=5949 RepID=A0A078AW12_STYLE|nr:UNKNOWN [Stylonychia lemnae]|eukprot:CDW86276.1 UNKNOWN [Stylonychia lemnae]
MEAISQLKERLLKSDYLIKKYKEMEAELSLTQQERDLYKAQLEESKQQISKIVNEKTQDKFNLESIIQNQNLKIDELKQKQRDYDQMVKIKEDFEYNQRINRDENQKLNRKVAQLKNQLDQKTYLLQNLRQYSFTDKQAEEINSQDNNDLGDQNDFKFDERRFQGQEVIDIEQIKKEYENRLKSEKSLNKSETIEMFLKKRVAKSELKRSKQRLQKRVRFNDEQIIASECTANKQQTSDQINLQ